MIHRTAERDGLLGTSIAVPAQVDVTDLRAVARLVRGTDAVSVLSSTPTTWSSPGPVI